MNRRTLAVLATVTGALIPLAATRAVAQQGAPPAELAQLGVFIGNWACSGQLLATAQYPAHTTTAELHAEKMVDGHWILLRYDEDRTAANPHPYHVAQQLSYDAAGKRFVSIAVDNVSGSRNSTGSSPGWRGDAMTFDEAMEVNGKHMDSRDTFTKNDRGEISHMGSAQDASGKWVPMDKETCHRAG